MLVNVNYVRMHSVKKSWFRNPLCIYIYIYIYATEIHYIDAIMITMASQISSLTVVYSTAYSDADQRKYQSSTSLAFVWGIHRDRWIPAQRASYAAIVPIWWRHHVKTKWIWYKYNTHELVLTTAIQYTAHYIDISLSLSQIINKQDFVVAILIVFLHDIGDI